MGAMALRQILTGHQSHAIMGMGSLTRPWLVGGQLKLFVGQAVLLIAHVLPLTVVPAPLISTIVPPSYSTTIKACSRFRLGVDRSSGSAVWSFPRLRGD